MKNFVFAAFAAGLTVPAFGQTEVDIPFAAEIGGQPFSCGQTFNGLGKTAASMKAIDYRLFVSDVALVKQDGSLQAVSLAQDGRWQHGTVALLDFEDASGGCTNGTTGTNTSVRGTVPDGDYRGVAFTIGVPFDVNHVDPALAPSPLNNTAMFWNWQGGYKFIRIDLVPAGMKRKMAMRGGEKPKMPMKQTGKGMHGGQGKAKGWFLHLGSTMCNAASKTEAPTACKNQNRINVSFVDFKLGSDTVVIDPAPVLSDADLMVNAPKTSPGCMSFPGDADCTTVMPKLGQPYGDQPAQVQLLATKR